VSLSPSTDPDVLGVQRIFPPALKKCLILSADANVTDLVIVEVEFQVPLFVEAPTVFVLNAVALVEPPATSAASDAKSASTAALIAMESPAVTCVLDVNVSFV
jgi:hypothetical protein